MAGLPGKTAWFAGAKNVGGAKGAPATTSKYKNAFSGGNIAPRRETDRLSETDSSRDQGAAYVTVGGVEGTPEFFVRDSSIGFYLAAALGGVAAPTGTTPNFIHTITPAQALAYHTFWRNVGGTAGILERFDDCFVSGLTISADAGSPLSASASIMGLAATPLVSEPASPASIDKDQQYSFNNAAVTLGGSSTRAVSSFELTIENNVTVQQTDDVIPYDLAVGTREISLGFNMLFENPTEYKNFHYGVGGTALSPNIYTTDATFTFTLGANNEIKFTLPSIAYEEFPVEPDAGGDPITVAIRAVAQKAPAITDLLTVALKNQVVTYVT